MKKEFINPPELPDWKQSFSQIIVVENSGRTVYISGQVAVDHQKNLVGENNLAIQALEAFRNLITALKAAGAGAEDVVKLNIYVKNYKRTDAAPIGEAIRQFFPLENLPTSTWVGVESLAEEGFLIEVDAIAVIDLSE